MCDPPSPVIFRPRLDRLVVRHAVSLLTHERQAAPALYDAAHMSGSHPSNDRKNLYQGKEGDIALWNRHNSHLMAASRVTPRTGSPLMPCLRLPPCRHRHQKNTM